MAFSFRWFSLPYNLVGHGIDKDAACHIGHGLAVPGRGIPERLVKGLGDAKGQKALTGLAINLCFDHGETQPQQPDGRNALALRPNGPYQTVVLST
jgi:hypothetical protein